MRRLLAASSVVALPLAGALLFAQGAAAPSEGAGRSGLDLNAIDRSVDPCSDFYAFACGAWQASHPIPADRPRWGRFDELQERNLDILRAVLEAAAAGRDAARRQIGDSYASCMDEGAIERLGGAPLEPVFRRIAALSGTDGLPSLLADLHRAGVNTFFRLGAEPDFEDARTVIASVDQGGLGLPDRDYYVRDDPGSAALRQQYLEHVARLAALAGGAPAARAAAEAAAVMRVETALANAALDRVSRRSPAKVHHKMTAAQLQALAPRFEWTAYFARVGAPAIRTLDVREPEFLKAFNDLLVAAPIEDLRAYLRWHVVHAHAPILASEFVAEHFRFYGAVLQGVAQLPPRWKRCVQAVDEDLGDALGRAFVERAFGARAKADMLALVGRIEAALERDIRGLDWMTDATRQEALAKLHAVAEKIGYPDRWRDDRALEIVRGDAAGNWDRAKAFEFQRQMDRIGKPVDRREWTMTAPTVNAYYSAPQNTINFPAGILQPPFYSASADPAVNYGAAGAVIGHELTHGFDDQGRQFDGSGRLRDWWWPSDARAFEERAACFVDEYAAFQPLEGLALDGRLTFGENAADNGGLRLALLAYLASEARGSAAPDLDGFTPEQRLFVGYAQIWCENRRPEYERLQARTNPHAPGRFRVNGVVSNLPAFQAAFSCRAGAPMVRPAVCRLW